MATSMMDCQCCCACCTKFERFSEASGLLHSTACQGLRDGGLNEGTSSPFLSRQQVVSANRLQGVSPFHWVPGV